MISEQETSVCLIQWTGVEDISQWYGEHLFHTTLSQISAGTGKDCWVWPDALPSMSVHEMLLSDSL